VNRKLSHGDCAYVSSTSVCVLTFLCLCVGHGQTGNFANEWQGIGNNEPYLHFKALTQARAVKVFSLLPQRTQPKAKPTRRSKSVTELSNREGLRAKRDKQPRVVPSNSSSSTHMGMGVKTKSPPEFVGSKLRKLSVAGLHIICFMAMACTLNAHLITRNGRGTIQPAHHHGPPRRLWRQIKLISFFWVMNYLPLCSRRNISLPLTLSLFGRKPGSVFLFLPPFTTQEGHYDPPAESSEPPLTQAKSIWTTFCRISCYTNKIPHSVSWLSSSSSKGFSFSFLFFCLAVMICHLGTNGLVREARKLNGRGQKVPRVNRKKK